MKYYSLCFQYVHYEVDYSACPDAGKQKNTQSNQGAKHRQVRSKYIYSITACVPILCGSKYNLKTSRTVYIILAGFQCLSLSY